MQSCQQPPATARGLLYFEKEVDRDVSCLTLGVIPLQPAVPGTGGDVPGRSYKPSRPLAICRRLWLTPENRLIFGVVALLLLGLTLAVFASMLPKKPGLQQVVIKQSLQGK